MEAVITLLPGDGIGPDVTVAAKKVLDAVADLHGHSFEYHEAMIGGAAIDACGDPLPNGQRPLTRYPPSTGTARPMPEVPDTTKASGSSTPGR